VVPFGFGFLKRRRLREFLGLVIGSRWYWYLYCHLLSNAALKSATRFLTVALVANTAFGCAYVAVTLVLGSEMGPAVINRNELLVRVLLTVSHLPMIVSSG